jgi:hypothetical protein
MCAEEAKVLEKYAEMRSAQTHSGAKGAAEVPDLDEVRSMTGGVQKAKKSWQKLKGNVKEETFLKKCQGSLLLIMRAG